jgi:hypothetical protein
MSEFSKLDNGSKAMISMCLSKLITEINIIEVGEIKNVRLIL